MGMTKTSTAQQICFYCGTAAATAIKVEIEREYDDADGGKEIEIEVEHLICDGCADYWFDGTEDRPGTKPLH